MAVPSTVKRYNIKQYLAKHLATADVVDVLEALDHEVPDADAPEFQAWADAIEHVRVRLVT